MLKYTEKIASAVAIAGHLAQQDQRQGHVNAAAKTAADTERIAPQFGH